MATNGSSALNTEPTQVEQKTAPVQRRREYLGLKPLTYSELPPHKDFPQDSKSTLALSSFLNPIFEEAYQIDLENGWTSHGIWQPKSNQGKIKLPPKPTLPDGTSRDAPITVEKRVKGTGKKLWLARRSQHDGVDMDFSELDQLLAEDHARLEGEYTPSVFDANELLKWETQDLQRAVADLKPEWAIERIQMSIYQMFHLMPSAMGGLVKLQHRVFHVLVVTAHSSYNGEGNGSDLSSQAMTLQMPVDLHSFGSIPAIMERSHADASVKRYRSTSSSSAEQQTNNGNKLTEGCYVSLERLRKVPVQSDQDGKAASYSNQWDMMTMSDAKGITSIASKKQITDGTLDAVTKDVYYVLDRIGKQRQDELNQTGGAEKKEWKSLKEEEIQFKKVSS